MKKTLTGILIINLVFLFACGKKSNVPKKVKTVNVQNNFELALRFEEEGNFNKAIHIYKNMVMIDPYNVQALRNLYNANMNEGNKFFEEGEFEKAIYPLEIAYKFYKTDELKEKLITSLLFVENNESAKSKKIELLEKVVSYDGENLRALSKLGFLYEGDNNKKAIKNYERVIVINPEDESVKLKLSKLYEQEGNSEKEDVIDTIKNVENIKLSRDDFDYYRQKAQELYENKEYAKAGKIYELLLTSDQEKKYTSQFLDILVYIYFEEKRFLDVFNLYNTYSEIDMSNENNRYYILLSIIELKKPEIFNRTMSEFTEKTYTFPYFKKKYVYFKYFLSIDDVRNVEALIDEVKKQNNDSFTASLLNEFAFYYSQKKDFKAAIGLIDQQMAFEETAEAHFNKAIFLEKLKEYRAALKSYERCVELSPDNPKYRYYKILSLKRNRKYEDMDIEKKYVLEKFQGSKWADYVKNIFGDKDLAGNVKTFSDVESYYSYGLEYAKNGEFDKALYNFKMAFKIQPENFNILINIGNIYVALEKYSDAIPYYILAQNYSENNSYIKFFQAKCYFELGLYTKAYDLFKESYELDDQNKDTLTMISLCEEKKEYELQDNLFNAYKEIGISAFNESFYDISYAFFKQAYDINSDHIFVLSSLSHILMKKELFDEARKYIDRIMLLFPDEFETNKLNFDFYFIKDKIKAADVLKNMKTLFPQEKWIFDKAADLKEYIQDDQEIENILLEGKELFVNDFELIRKINKVLGI